MRSSDDKAQPTAVSPVAVLARLEARARSVASELPQDSGPDAGAAHYIGFRLGELPLLASMKEILEILPYPDLSRVPGAKPWLRGISQNRGRLLSVVDISMFLGGPQTPVRRGTRILMIEHEELLSGMVVDEVYGMKHHFGVPRDFTPPDSQAWLASAVRSAVDIDETTWGLLDVDGIIQNPEFFRAAA